ncbi:unnamed protein product, partial [Didymodactylos carnosus]
MCEVGCRVLVDGRYFARVLYVGTVDGKQGVWYGIDWEDWIGKGKHNGTFEGRSYFKAKHDTSGSFVRKERLYFGQSFMQAVFQQYIKPFFKDDESVKLATTINQTDDSHLDENDEISYDFLGKHFESHMRQLNDIERIDLSNQYINSFSQSVITSDIHDSLQSMHELDIRKNLLNNWSEIWLILIRFRSQITIFNCSNCRLDLTSTDEKFERIEELMLIDQDNDWYAFEPVLVSFPGLKRLYLDLNRITYLTENVEQLLSNLRVLSLSGNKITEWEHVNYLGKLQHLEEIGLNDCYIKDIQIPIKISMYR